MDANQESEFELEVKAGDGMNTHHTVSPSLPNITDRDDSSFLFNFYSDTLKEKVAIVAGVVRDSILGVVLDEELEHLVGDVKISKNGDELTLEHSIIHKEENQLILPDTEFLGDQTNSHGCPHKAIDINEGELPFVIVSTLKLNENGLPEVSHKIKLTDSGYIGVIKSFNLKHDENWFNVPGEGEYSHLNKQVELFLDSLLKEAIEKESAGSDVNVGGMDDEQLAQHMKLGTGTDRHKLSLPETNDEYHFNMLSKYYRYFSIDSSRIIDRDTMTISLEIQVPKLEGVLNTDNLIYLHATNGSLDTYQDTETKYIEELPLEMDFMRFIEWETINLEISLDDGFLSIKKVDAETS